MNPLILQTVGQIVPLLFFKKDGFGIQLSKKGDMSLNNKTKYSPYISSLI